MSIELTSWCAALAAAAVAVFLTQPATANEQAENPMVITITTAPTSKMRYPTVGDWQFEPDGSLHITVAKMPNRHYEFLVALHEIVEAMLCKQSGVAQHTVDNFDMSYERHRKSNDNSEPGDARGAPYHRQHVIASVTERLAAELLKVDWNRYNDAVEAPPR